MSYTINNAEVVAKYLVNVIDKTTKHKKDDYAKSIVHYVFLFDFTKFI